MLTDCLFDVRRRLTGVRFKKEQLRQIRVIWDHRAWSDIDLAGGRWPASRHRGENTGIGTGSEEEGVDEEDEYESDGRGDNEDDEDVKGTFEEGEQDDHSSEGGVAYRSDDECQDEDESDSTSGAVHKLLSWSFSSASRSAPRSSLIASLVLVS